MDVLSLVLGATDTPAFRRLLAERGVLAGGADDASPIPGVSTADEVVTEALANLSNGPTWFVGEQLREGTRQMGALTRSELVKVMRERTTVMDTGDATGVAR